MKDFVVEFHEVNFDFETVIRNQVPKQLTSVLSETGQGFNESTLQYANPLGYHNIKPLYEFSVNIFWNRDLRTRFTIIRFFSETVSNGNPE